jgi:sugar lactone lactonase YvrE
MYYIDTPTQEVSAFDYDDATGAIGNRRPAVRVPKADGSPDGSTLDADGNLWVAHWGGWRVTCYDPVSGAALRSIKLPVSLVTSCAFGGPDLATLYITSSGAHVEAAKKGAEPLAGGLFRVNPGVRGVTASAFAG